MVLVTVGVMTISGLLVAIRVTLASAKVAGLGDPMYPEGKETGAPEVAPSIPSIAFAVFPELPAENDIY